jgi:hypothetical protein
MYVCDASTVRFILKENKQIKGVKSVTGICKKWRISKGSKRYKKFDRKLHIKYNFYTERDVRGFSWYCVYLCMYISSVLSRNHGHYSVTEFIFSHLRWLWGSSRSTKTCRLSKKCACALECVYIVNIYWQAHGEICMYLRYSDKIMGWMTEESWFDSMLRQRTLLQRVHTGCGPHLTPIPRVSEPLSPGVKRPGREAEVSPPYSAEGKDEWRHVATPMCFHTLHNDGFASTCS